MVPSKLAWATSNPECSKSRDRKEMDDKSLDSTADTYLVTWCFKVGVFGVLPQTFGCNQLSFELPWPLTSYTTAAHWVFSLSGASVRKPQRWLRLKITVQERRSTHKWPGPIQITHFFPMQCCKLGFFLNSSEWNYSWQSSWRFTASQSQKSLGKLQ